MSFLRINKLFLFYLYISVLLLLESTWVKEVFSFPSRVYQIMTVFVYLPFVAVIIYKFICDIKMLKTKQYKLLDGLYYAFLIYFGALSIFRFIKGAPIKDGIYYTLVIAGSLAIFQLISTNRLKISMKEFVLNNKLLGTAIVIYSLLCFAFVGNVLAHPPININITGTLVVMFLPVMATFFEEKLTSKFQTVWCILLFSSFIVILVTAGSRSIFWMFVVSMIVLFVISIGDKQRLLCLLSCLLISIIIVGALFALNVGTVRYSIARETGINFLSSTQLSTDPTDDFFFDSAEMDELNKATAQISRSDSMRSDLLKMGLDQIKKNPLFGTGHIFFNYYVSGYVFKQAPHNFIVETLVCYGIIGTILLAIMIIMIIAQCGFFSKWTSKDFRMKASICLICMCYFAISFVEPLMYNILVCPHFFLLLSLYKLLIQDTKKELNCTT